MSTRRRARMRREVHEAHEVGIIRYIRYIWYIRYIRCFRLCIISIYNVLCIPARPRRHRLLAWLDRFETTSMLTNFPRGYWTGGQEVWQARTVGHALAAGAYLPSSQLIFTSKRCTKVN